MKLIITVLFSFLAIFTFAQEAAIDSSSYNVGYTIGENLPVAIILIIAIFFIYKSYRKSSTDDKKTDFMDDGTITK